MRATMLVGRIHGRELLIVPVAYCNVCRASRLLAEARVWKGWPKDEAPVTGECSGCGSTVSITSRAPSEEPAA